MRDESAEEIRIVIEPRSRNVEKENLLTSLYQFTDLETKVAVNLNVLIDGISPKVSNLKELLKTFLGSSQRNIDTKIHLPVREHR